MTATMEYHKRAIILYYNSPTKKKINTNVIAMFRGSLAYLKLVPKDILQNIYVIIPNFRAGACGRCNNQYSLTHQPFQKKNLFFLKFKKLMGGRVRATQERKEDL